MLTVEDCEQFTEQQFDTVFDTLCSIDLSVGYDGRDRLIKKLNTLYKKIPEPQIKIFLDFCEPCQ